MTSIADSTVPIASPQQFDAAAIYDQAITKLRSQVWVGMMWVSIINLTVVGLIRFNVGSSTPLGISILITMYVITIGGLLLRHTEYVAYFQIALIVVLHSITPIVFIFFGGTQGNGDVTLFLIVMLALLYGFKRWMIVSFAASVGAFFYVIYLELIGQPVAPFLEDASRAFAIKSLLFISLVVLAFYIGYRFYSQLVASYSQFSSDQLLINQELQEKADTRRQLNKDLQKSRLKIVASREDERRRLRRDLHDGLGPTMAVQIFRVGAARNVIYSQPEKAQTYLVDLESGLENTMGDVRRLIHELRPAVLEELGLLGAIRNHAQNLEAPFALHLNLPSMLEGIDKEVEVAVWRIVQTALDNVAQHAHAQNCTLTLSVSDDLLTLSVADDGAGLAAGNQLTENLIEGVGLTSMRERSQALNGQLTFEAVEPNGMELLARIPAYQKQQDQLSEVQNG